MAKRLGVLVLDYRAIAHWIGALGTGDPDPLAVADRHDADDFPILIGQESHPRGSNHGCIVPVTATGRAVVQVKHDLGQTCVLEGGPELRDKIRHRVGLAREAAIMWFSEKDVAV